MPKVMLVEDDNNLREIYEARLQAEGYEIVSAKDGEEALALSVKERPDLIIADVMMPKISGFDMLDILRSTPETKETKVIMMTALSQAEDKDRAKKLGADRYLVKSQVTLEDVAKVAREVLDGKPAGDTNAGVSPVIPSPPPEPAVPADQPGATPDPATATPAAPPATDDGAMKTSDPGSVSVDVQDAPVAKNDDEEKPSGEQAPSPAQTNDSMLADAVDKMGGADAGANRHLLENASGKSESQESSSNNVKVKTSVHTKVINPINDISKPAADLEALVAAEDAKVDLARSALNPPEKAKPIVTDIKPSGVKATGAQLEPKTIQPSAPPGSHNANDPGAIAL